MTPTLLQTIPARGRSLIIFIQTHTDNTEYGPFVELRGLADDISAFLTAHAAALLASLVAAEIADRLSLIVANGSLAVVPALRFATLADVQAALRAFYSTAVRDDAIMVGDYFNVTFPTDAQLRVVLGITLAQATALRANKLAPATALATSIRAATGA